MKRIICVVLTLFMTAALLGGCGSKKAADGDTLSGRVSTNGSTSMETVIGMLKEQFAIDHAGVTVSYDATGSGTGIESVSNGSCDIGLSSRKLKDSETGLTATTRKHSPRLRPRHNHVAVVLLAELRGQGVNVCLGNSLTLTLARKRLVTVDLCVY